MTPKEKAEELVDIYIDITETWSFNGIHTTNVKNYDLSKQCALIAVYETQQLIKDLSSCKNRFIYIVDEMNYWIEVKQEIEKL
jgi:alpha-L-arabinofuranosidase